MLASTVQSLTTDNITLRRVIGVSLSEPHTSVTALSMHMTITVVFQSAPTRLSRTNLKSKDTPS